jgi:hypothetical protein
MYHRMFYDRIIMCMLMLTVYVFAQTQEHIGSLALHGLASPNLQEKKGDLYLYGVRTNGPNTEHGRLACALVVSAVLKQAQVMQPVVGVRHIEAHLESLGWQKITRKKDLQPGDVVIWNSRWMGRKDKRCTGGGNCHVGIFTSKGYFHNHPDKRRPVINKPSVLRYAFKNAFRAPAVN